MHYRIKALIIKEILAIWRDKKSRILLIGPPLIQLLVFSFAVTLDVKNVDIDILNEDTGFWGKELSSRIQTCNLFRQISQLNDEDRIQSDLDSGRVLAVIKIPQDFSKRIEKGQSVGLQLLLDGRRSNAAQVLTGYMNGIVAGLSNSDQWPLQTRKPPISILGRFLFNPNLDYKWFTVPSLIAILTTLISLLVTTLSIARERELGTFDQLLVSPLQPMEILAGKTLPALILGMAEGTLILLVAIFFFGIPFRGNFWLLYLGMFIFILAMVGIGLFISSLCMTQQQAILGAFVFMAPSMILSGFATPIENMPKWLQTITWFDPIRHFLVVVRGIFVKGMTAIEVWHNSWPLLVIASITLSAATILFRQKLE